MNVTWVTPLGELTDSMAKRSSRPSRPSRGTRRGRDDRHDHDVHVVDQAGGEELADGGRAAADADVEATRGLLAAASASAGLASMKWKVVPPFISIEGLT